jgi:sortase A
MNKKTGIACMIAGVLLLASAVLLLFYNRQVAAQAGEAAQTALTEIRREIGARRTAQQAELAAQSGASSAAASSAGTAQSEQRTGMTVAKIGGYDYVGYLAIPALGLQLPVMADCDLTRMGIAPCRQFGSTWTDDLVIAGHNYRQHFGEIQTLGAGDAVQFTDMDGNEISYLVREIRLVKPGDVDKAKNSRGAAAQPSSSAYAASPTGSSHSVEAFSPGTPTERWLNQESRLAPCQCRTPGAMLTTSPGRSARAGLPAS